MPTPRRPFEAGDLLYGEDQDFVITLYIALLRRWPDEGGYRHYLELIANRPERRAEALREIAASEEAQRVAAPMVMPATGPILPSDPRGALQVVLALRSEWLAEQLTELREALALQTGGPELASLGAEVIESRDAALRSELSALRREVAERLEGVVGLLGRAGVPEEAAVAATATAEERAAKAVSTLLAGYVGDLLAASQMQTEARLRALEARILALEGR
ncbi:hypothetical protein GCM10011504_14150 [Siccirubricoccus deserti]|uniref:DUF4214 domain-containing protein n=1 Tax=Siccirubricoccus deserti TaxID=2013562 RepID=A0A9X0QX81_9PROT|nr:DUF4214 domain-containing protein [Siccirubricoccus deserti]MBC4014933.1 DUF4214 domain-containing protein [Siccirubricoccus deserti]GGC36961.1 hypothetical protein GCM10011504_14150 [Siccirubricoccus deserti]